MDKKFIFIIITILLLTGCTNILKWDEITDKNWQDIRLVENVGSVYNPPKIKIDDEGTIYIIYKENTTASNKLYLLSKKEHNDKWEIELVAEKNTLNDQLDFILDKQGEPNIFYQTNESDKIIFYWWKKSKGIIKNFNTQYSPTVASFEKIKCFLDKNDNMIVFYKYALNNIGYIQRLDFGKDLTSDVAMTANGQTINDYDVILDKEKDKFHIVYNNTNSFPVEILYTNSSLINDNDNNNDSHKIRDMSTDFSFSNFSINFDNDKIVIGYSLYSSPEQKSMVEKIAFSKERDNNPPFFPNGEIITEINNSNILKSSLFVKNGIVYAFTLPGSGYDKVYYTKMNKSYYEKELQLTGVIPPTTPSSYFFVDKKGYSYILYLNGDTTKKELRLLTNRPL